MTGRVGFIPHRQCKVASGECFTRSKCLEQCNPKELQGLSVEQLLIVAARRQRKQTSNSSRVAARIDELVADIRRGSR